MDIIYFLIFVGICGGALMWFVRSVGRKEENARRAQKQQQHYEHVRTHDPLRHGHARYLNTQPQHMWGNRREHVHEERGSYSLTARKIDFDGEPEESAETNGAAMTAIKYTPTEIFQASSQKR